MRPIDSPTNIAVHDHLNEQWEAAVSAGVIKTTWQREAKTITVYSRSLIVTFLLQYSISICSIFAVGKIGKLELGAVSLATMTGNITFWAPVQGLATCLDTLCSQAFGSGHKTLVGLQVQRMACFLLLVTVPLAIIWWNSIEILAALLPERRSAELAGQYLRILIIGMPSFVFFECGKRFVQSQGLFTANTYVLFIAAPLNVFLNWFFVWHLEFGFLGAPTAVVITQWLMPTLLVLYVIFIDGSQCWGGFSKRMFSNWGKFIERYKDSKRTNTQPRTDDQISSAWHDHGRGRILCFRDIDSSIGPHWHFGTGGPVDLSDSIVDDVPDPLSRVYRGIDSGSQPNWRQTSGGCKTLRQSGQFA